MEIYLSIKEFSERVNKSEQSIYKRLRKPDDAIHKYVKLKDGKKVISENAIENLYNNITEYEEITEEKTVKDDNNIINLLKEQIEQLKQENEFKTKQIEDLTEQLKASSTRETNYQMLLNQQQQLSASDKQKILQLESAAEKKRKGIFGIFKKKGEKE